MVYISSTSLASFLQGLPFPADLEGLKIVTHGPWARAQRAALTSLDFITAYFPVCYLECLQIPF